MMNGVPVYTVWLEELSVIFLVVVSSEMVTCGGRNGHRKACCHVTGVVAVLPTSRLRRWLSFWINGGEFGDDGAE